MVAAEEEVEAEVGGARAVGVGTPKAEWGEGSGGEGTQQRPTPVEEEEKAASEEERRPLV